MNYHKQAPLRYHVYPEGEEDHNVRNADTIAAENAKNRDRWIGGKHETLGEGKTELEAYEALFGDAVEEYNAKQKRKDRRLTVEDYRDTVKADTRGKTNKAIASANKRAVENGRPENVRKEKGKHTSYEVVLSIGNVRPARDDKTGQVKVNPAMTFWGINHVAASRDLPNAVNDATCRAIYDEYIKAWPERNPNFYLYRVDYHADEWFKVKPGTGGKDITDIGGPSGEWQQGTPHEHLDFIPWAEGYKQGLSRQVSVNKALAAMGFTDRTLTGKDGKSYTLTAWEQWQDQERAYIAKIAAEHGIELIKGDRQRGDALSAEEYQALQEALQMKAEAEADRDAAREMLQQAQERLSAVDAREEAIAPREEALKAGQGHLAADKKKVSMAARNVQERLSAVDAREKAVTAREEALKAAQGQLEVDKKKVSMAARNVQERLSAVDAREKAVTAREAAADRAVKDMTQRCYDDGLMEYFWRVDIPGGTLAEAIEKAEDSYRKEILTARQEEREKTRTGKKTGKTGKTGKKQQEPSQKTAARQPTVQPASQRREDIQLQLRRDVQRTIEDDDEYM